MQRLPSLMLAALALSACSGGGGVQTSPAPSTTTVRVVGTGGASSNINMVEDGPGMVTRTVAGSVDAVFGVLPAVYDSLGIPINVRDRSVHQVGNSGYSLRHRMRGTPLGRYFDCGSTQGAPSVDSYDIRLSVVSTVQPGPSAGLSTLTTTVDVMGRPAAFSGEYVRCSSNGALEARIVAAAKALVGG